MGWKPILVYINLLEKKGCYQRFLRWSWAVTGNMEDFLQGQVDNIGDWAVTYAYRSYLLSLVVRHGVKAFDHFAVGEKFALFFVLTIFFAQWLQVA